MPDHKSPGIALLAGMYLLGILGIVASGGGDDYSISPFTLVTGIAIADLNGDGQPDLATSNILIDSSPPHPANVTVYLQLPGTAAEFGNGVDYPVGSDSQYVTTGKLNDDDRIDLLATNYGDDSISLLKQSPSAGVFLSEPALATATHPDGCVVADINADGVDDIVVSGAYLTTLLNSPANPGSFTPGGGIDSKNYLPSVTAGDIDGDNRIDLAAADITSGTVLVFLQDAAPAAPGGFSTSIAYPAGAQPIDVELADVDGDSKLDLVVANLGTPSDPNTASVAVLLQNHDPTLRGEFLPAVVYATGARSEDVAVGDLNDDARPDLAVANAGRLNDNGSVSILLQSGAPGQFSSAVNIAGISQPLALAIGDLNADGLNDIAVADGGAVLLLQDAKAPGTFRPAMLVNP